VPNGQPKPAFYVVVGLVVIALVAFAIWRLSPKPSTTPSSAPDIKPPPTVAEAKGPEVVPAKVDPSELTEKTYEIVPEERLIPAKGTAGYKKLADTKGTVRFAINVWAGWGPIILANDGFKAGKVWKTPDGQEFKVELVLIDDVVAMREAFATGNVHIGWSTLDMVPLFLQTLVKDDGTPRDTRVMPRVYQQIDWSNGGDGMVVRKDIQTIGQLKGKQVVLAQFSPSHYFALNMLVNGGVQPRDVKFVYTKTAFQAAAAFNDRKELSAAVSWSPDIYKLTKGDANRLLVTTSQANKLIADVWFARADFARDYPGIIESLVRGIFDAMNDLQVEDEKKAEAAKKHVAELMAAGYNLPADVTLDMQGDAHITNWAENSQFFLNANNPTNFERTWNNAYFLYSHPQIKAITHKPVPFDQVMDFTFIKKLGQEEKYRSQKEEKKTYVPAPVPEGTSEILGNRFYIHFFPNSYDLHKKVIRPKDGKDVEEPYDPNVDATVEKIAQVVGQFGGAAQIVIEGHTDSSNRSQVPAADLPDLTAQVKKLSEERANAVKQALVEKYKFDPNQLSVRGMGWDRPADPADPNNQALNRRVEVKVYSAEAK
jgi:NitT/TauT family transport system substrate-binding protein